MKSNANGLFGQTLVIKILTVSVLMILWAGGCSSGPSETPEKFVLNFIQKHIPMIDTSVADFYVKEEQAGVMARVQKFIESKKKNGNFESLSAAVYDFSKIKVDILEEKQEYVNDEGVDFLKVAARGSYTKTVNGKSESLTEDETIIIESVRGKWRVTEKINPWD
jgi:hypothetical protein